MSGTINKVILIGHLGDEVKMNYFEGGNSIGRFPIATNETYTNRQTGERVSTTEWHNIVVRNKLAETCEKYLSKGDKVYCEGRIKTRQWEQDGQKRYTTEIHVTNMTFLSSKNEAGAPTPSNTTHQSQATEGSKSVIEEDDDLPF
ncbi:single-stranded DNA-binding protein [Pseudotenacibaculum haliotis]|uniref:Single-stranded DNA-binding protein n=1 Tax=Pseudotenacibaculum haliotis TaxID=1862138 RepID=A0ABW5LQR4_9FLAO